MNFSEFANMIHPYDKEGKTQSGFVLYLIDQIMEDPFTEADKQKASKDEYNPLANLKQNTLEKIFNGSKNISKRSAKNIRAHLDKDKFDNYIITKFNNEAIDSLGETLKNANISIIDDSVSLTCANTFENILKDIIEGNPKDSTTLKVKKAEPPKDNRPFEEIFNDAIRELGVESFLESDPTESLPSHFLNDMEQFVGKMRQIYDTENALKTKLEDARKVKCENTFIFNPEKSSYKDEKTSRKMFEFSETLFKYVKYLKKRMNLISTEKVNHDRYVQERYEMPEASYTKYKPPKDNKNFGRYSLKYRNNLKSLYDEIQTLQQK